MTAFAVVEDPDFTMGFKSHNIDGFLQKPFSIRQLNKMVKNHMSYVNQSLYKEMQCVKVNTLT
jgi:DNA-binding response OmpR family regulator